MPNNIANVTIPAPVIQLNNKYFLTDGQYDPVTMPVPCGINAEVDYFEWWMTPVNDFGIISILQAIPAEGENVSQPTPDSISVIRVRDKYKPHYTWFVVCTLAEYYASCQTCCGDAFTPIPTPTLPLIIPCQSVCDSTDANGNFIAVFGIPELPAGQHFVGNASFNGVSQPQVTGATAALLLTAIISNWFSGESPAVVWTKSSDNLTLTGTGWSENDVVCILIQTST